MHDHPRLYANALLHDTTAPYQALPPFVIEIDHAIGRFEQARAIAVSLPRGTHDPLYARASWLLGLQLLRTAKPWTW